MKFRYWYYVIGRKVVFCGCGHQPRDHYRVPVMAQPKSPAFQIVAGDEYSPRGQSIRFRRFKVKPVYAPDWDAAVKFIKSQWGGGK